VPAIHQTGRRTRSRQSEDVRPRQALKQLRRLPVSHHQHEEAEGCPVVRRCGGPKGENTRVGLPAGAWLTGVKRHYAARRSGNAAPGSAVAGEAEVAVQPLRRFLGPRGNRVGERLDEAGPVELTALDPGARLREQ
jgi:hypothetical protein